MTERKKTYESAPDRIEAAEKLLLWVRSGGRCAMCNKWLLDDEHRLLPIPSGEMAHNVGRSTSSRSPRGDDPLAVDERNLAANLLLLCPDDHQIIDTKLGTDEFPVEKLRDIKARHEDRIRRLTEPGENDETVVVRLVGRVRDTAPTVDAETVRLTAAADGRYPRFELAVRSTQDVEIDLRRVDEDASYYWDAVTDHIAEAADRLDEAHRRGLVRHLSVFAFGRIPALVLLGHRLDDKTPTAVYPYYDGAWGWPDDGDEVAFEFGRIVAGDSDGPVTVLMSVSGPVDPDRVPPELARGAVYELRPAGADPGRDLLRTAASLQAFAAAWRRLLALVEREHRGLDALHVVPAVPLTAAVEIGRTRTRDVHPPLVIWDRDGGTYTRTLEIAP
jgi:hypothetical protein